MKINDPTYLPTLLGLAKTGMAEHNFNGGLGGGEEAMKRLAENLHRACRKMFQKV